MAICAKKKTPRWRGFLVRSRRMLLINFSNYSGANCSTTLADSEEESLFHSNWSK